MASKGKEYYKQNIIEDSPVKIFTATNTAMFEYPYILGRVGSKSPTLCEQSDLYILDSGIGDDSVDNEMVFSAANDISADIVVPKDVISNTEATTEAIIDMDIRVSGTDLTMVIPLQSDDRLTRSEHYYEIAEELNSDIEDHIVAVGGVMNEKPSKQLIETVKVRKHIPDDQWLHAFGCGISHDWVVAMRKYPNIVDSIDTSRVQREVGNGKTIDAKMNVVDSPMPRGANSTCISSMHRERILYMVNHMIGPHSRDSDVPTEFNSAKTRKFFDENV